MRLPDSPPQSATTLASIIAIPPSSPYARASHQQIADAARRFRRAPYPPTPYPLPPPPRPRQQSTDSIFPLSSRFHLTPAATFSNASAPIIPVRLRYLYFRPSRCRRRRRRSDSSVPGSPVGCQGAAYERVARGRDGPRHGRRRVGQPPLREHHGEGRVLHSYLRGV